MFVHRFPSGPPSRRGPDAPAPRSPRGFAQTPVAGVSSRLSVSNNTLSSPGGQKQRIAVARALLKVRPRPPAGLACPCFQLETLRFVTFWFFALFLLSG